MSSGVVVEPVEQGVVDLAAVLVAHGLGVVALGLDGVAVLDGVKNIEQDSQMVSYWQSSSRGRPQ